MPGLEWCRGKACLLTAVPDCVDAYDHEENVKAVGVRAQVDEEVECIAER